jgi:hypothetical protein
MPLVVFRVEYEDAAFNGFLKAMKRRTDNSSVARNPFITKYRWLGERTHAYSFTPLYPPVYWIAIFPAAAWLLFQWKLLLLLTVIFALPAVFWTAPFYHVLLRFSLRQQGFKGRIKHLSAAEGLRVVLRGTG